MVLTLGLNPEEAGRLAALAEREGRPVSEVAHDLLMQSVDDDAAEETWAAAVVAEWETSDQHTRPLTDLRTELGL